MTPKLCTFVKFIFDTKNYKEFWQIKQFFENTKPKLNKSIFGGIFGDKGPKNQSVLLQQQSDNLMKKYSIFDNQSERLESKRPLSFNQLPNKSFNPISQPIFAPHSNPSLDHQNYPQQNPTPQLPPNNLAHFYQEELKTEQRDSFYSEKNQPKDRMQNFQLPRPLNKTTFQNDPNISHP